MTQKRSKSSTQRSKGKADVVRVASHDNPEIKMSPKTRSVVRALQKKSTTRCNAEAELMQTLCESSEELTRRRQVMAQIAKKLGIYDDLKELSDIASTRTERLRKAVLEAGDMQLESDKKLD